MERRPEASLAESPSYRSSLYSLYKPPPAYTSLPAAAKANYEDSKKPLTERFEPSSERELYLAEWHTRGQSKAEGWAEFKEDLKQLTYKAYPELPDEAKEQMALNQYMRHLQNPQLAFSVKQIRPKLWMKQ